MPPRPFPLAFNVGTDIVQTARINRLITKPNANSAPDASLNKFLKRLFTEREISIFREANPNLRSTFNDNVNRVTAHLAGRWAAKEAAIKAVKPRRITHKEVEILPLTRSGGIYAVILDSAPATDETYTAREQDKATTDSHSQFTGPGSRDRLYEDMYESSSGQIARISISHEDEYATAVCIATEDAGPEDVGGEAAARMP